VRRLCLHCREPCQLSREVMERFSLEAEDSRGQFHRAVGCSSCSGIGYSGRTGLMELLEFSEPVRRAVLARADSSQIEKVAENTGMRTMFRHGVELAARGVTTLEEVLRVTRAGD